MSYHDNDYEWRESKPRTPLILLGFIGFLLLLHVILCSLQGLLQ